MLKENYLASPILPFQGLKTGGWRRLNQLSHKCLMGEKGVKRQIIEIPGCSGSFEELGRALCNAD